MLSAKVFASSCETFFPHFTHFKTNKTAIGIIRMAINCYYSRLYYQDLHKSLMSEGTQSFSGCKDIHLRYHIKNEQFMKLSTLEISF